jgi:hypothetical protein
VQHVDRLIELCEVDDAMLGSCADANLTNAETNRWHGLPVVRLETTLNSPELKSCHLSRIGGEATQIVPGGPEPDHWLLGHVSLYKYRHVRSTTRTNRSPNLRLERTGVQLPRRARAPVAAGRSAARSLESASAAVGNAVAS